MKEDYNDFSVYCDGERCEDCKNKKCRYKKTFAIDARDADFTRYEKEE